MKKRFFGVFIVIALLVCTLVLVSCSNNNDSNDTSPAQTTNYIDSNVFVLEEGATPGVAYGLTKDSNGNEYYSVGGGGTQTDTDIVISATCNGLPVKRVYWRDDPNITSMTIPDSVESVDFMGCTSLKTVKLGNGLKRLGNFAFAECKSLTTLVLPESLETIEERVFENCSSLTEITIHSANVVRGFSGCDSLQKVTIGDGVAEIGESCFASCKKLETVVLGNNIKTIGASAFSLCESLREIDLPNSITSIGHNAFFCCDSLESITIPNNISRIEEHTFYYCKNLKTVDLGDHVEYIGESAFSSCQNLHTVTVGNKLTEIGKSAFSACIGLEKITLGDNLETIGEEAFSNCYELNSITLGSKVKTIGNKAFEMCYKLAEIANKSSLNIVAGASGSGDIAKYAENVYDPATEQSKLYTTDDGFVFLKDLRLLVDYDGDKITVTTPVTFENTSDYTVRDYAFYKESSIYQLIVGTTDAKFETNAIWDCDNLVSLVLNGLSKEKIICIDCAKIVEKADSSSMEITDDGFWFYGNTLVAYSGEQSDITLPTRANKYAIGEHAFANADITSVKIPENTVTEIGVDAFNRCSDLVSINIPNGVTSIGHYAFTYCDSLTTVNIPESVTKVGNDAFSGCSALEFKDGLYFDNWLVKGYWDKNITIAAGTVGIADSVFNDYNSSNKNIESITLPEGLKYIGDSAFRNCSSLKTVNLPTTVLTIVRVHFSTVKNLPILLYQAELKK